MKKAIFILVILFSVHGKSETTSDEGESTSPIRKEWIHRAPYEGMSRAAECKWLLESLKGAHEMVLKSEEQLKECEKTARRPFACNDQKLEVISAKLDLNFSRRTALKRFCLQDI